MRESWAFRTASDKSWVEAWEIWVKLWSITRSSVSPKSRKKGGRGGGGGGGGEEDMAFP